MYRWRDRDRADLFRLQRRRFLRGKVFGIRCGQFHPRFDRILEPLENPHALPCLALAKPGRFVAERGDQRDALVLHQTGDELRDVEVRTPGVQLRHLQELLVLPHPVRQRRGCRQAWLRPERWGLQPIQQPASQRPLLLRLPRLVVPAALVLRLLDQRDARVLLDGLDPTPDQRAVRRRPVLGDLGDGCRAVPLEPLRLRPLPLRSSAPGRSRRRAHRGGSRVTLPGGMQRSSRRHVVESVAAPVESLPAGRSSAHGSRGRRVRAACR